MSVVYRLDRLNIDAARAERIEHDYIRISGAVIARGGVLSYLRGDGKIEKELRDPKVMHSPEALRTYEGKSLLLAQHPSKSDGSEDLLTPANSHLWRQVGTVSNVRASTAIDPDTGRSAPVTRADIVVSDGAAIKAIEAGLRQFSVGYEAAIERKPGTWRGEAYDIRQTSDVGNHVILTSSARAGKITEFRLDSSDAILIDSSEVNSPPQQRRVNMAQVTIGAFTGEIDPALAPLVNDLKTRADMYDKAKDDMADMEKEKGDMESEMVALKARIEELEGEVKALKATGDMAKDKEEEMRGDALDKAVAERLVLMQNASKMLPPEYSFNGKSSNQIRADALKSGLGIECSDGEIAGAWKVAVEQFARGDAGVRKLRNGLQKAKPRGDADDAYQHFIKAHHKAS